MRIGVDVDICVVRSDLYWLRWISEVSECYDPVETVLNDLIGQYGYGNVPYDLSQHFNLEQRYGVKELDWWKSRNLYDNMAPIRHAQDVIKHFGETNEIVFISAIKGDHGASKLRFLKRYFNTKNNVGFVYTREKYLVDVDIMIDDRLDILEKFKSSVIKIQVDTPYKQSTEFKPHFCGDWNGVCKYMTENKFEAV